MSDSARPAPFKPVPVIHVGRGDRRDAETTDLAAVEEPLEVRLHNRPFAVIMRTPGDDKALAAGFLLSEGVVATFADIGAVEHCRHPDQPDVHNVVDVYLLGEARASMESRLSERRNVTATSACGVCGRVSIESLASKAAKVPFGWTMSRATAAAMPARLRERQEGFEDTGGLHAAGLFDLSGQCVISAEDVGRHNAVDKVIGAMLLADRLPLESWALAVSGRVSYEIVQKAWFGGIGLVCAVSAPSTLAVELADEAQITLLGFAREGGFNVYTHPQRLSDL
jgi:FdhD protein